MAAYDKRKQLLTEDDATLHRVGGRGHTEQTAQRWLCGRGPRNHDLNKSTQRPGISIYLFDNLHYGQFC